VKGSDVDTGIWHRLTSSFGDGVTRPYSGARMIPMERILPNPDQPRKTVDEKALEELAGSIEAHGLLQPVLVRREGDHYVIIAGHRRYRACGMLGWEEIPAVIREETAERAIEQALIENVQREDINPIEEALTYQRLMDANGYSVREMAARVHKSHGYVGTRLELLRHADVAEAVAEGRIDITTARELARVRDAERRSHLLGQALEGRLGFDELRACVRVASPRTRGQPSVGELVARRWRALRKALDGMDAETVTPSEREAITSVLEEIRAAVEEAVANLSTSQKSER